MSPLFFVLLILPMSLVLREVKTGYHLGDIWGKANYILSIEELKFYNLNKKQIDTLVNTVRIFSE